MDAPLEALVIRGVPVVFPPEKKPYGPQLAFMAKTLQALQERCGHRRQGFARNVAATVLAAFCVFGPGTVWMTACGCLHPTLRALTTLAPQQTRSA